MKSFFTRHSVSTLIAISYQNELTPSLAKDDCAARKIVKNETQYEAEVGLAKPKEDSEEGLVDGEEDEGKDSDDDNNCHGDSDDEGRNNSNTSTPILGGETYAQRRERNIAENKKLLDEVKAKYPVREPKEARTRKNKG